MYKFSKTEIDEMLDYRKTHTLVEVGAKFGLPKESARKFLLANGANRGIPIQEPPTDYNPDPEWIAEFRGFFYGEGCALLEKAALNGHYKYRPQLSIQLRVDDERVVYEIQRHLGGNATSRSNRKFPHCSWQLVGWGRITNLLPFLYSGQLPSKKRDDLKLLYELCNLRLSWPWNLSSEHTAILEKYYLALRELKRYKGSDG